MKCFLSILFGSVLLAPLFASGEGTAPNNRIDELVFARQAETGFPPSERCPDAVFLRRVFVDVIGTIPTVGEARAFLDSPEGADRARLIDKLLDRDEFAVYLGLKWCDLFRVKAEFPSNLWPNAVQAYHHWVVDAFRRNMPYDQFARALLTTSGSNFRDAPVNFYRPFQHRTPRNILETAALIFMGVRLENSGWTEEELLGMDAFFGKVAYKKTSEWKEEIVYFDPTAEFLHPQTAQPVVPKPVNGPPLNLGAFDDPRTAFADWLTAPDNPWFAKAVVNRIWYQLMGRGIIHEVDDIRPDNPAWSPELLAFLERELIENQYDLRHIYRLILNSATYQLSAVSTYENQHDEKGFSHYRVRRMDAEVLIDAVCQITGTFEEYSSAIPEPFTYIPKEQRSIMLADGSIKSSFLEMFGRPGRDTSYESERSNDPTVFQSMHMLNSSHFQDKIMQSPVIRRLLQKVRRPAQRVVELYLHILSRYPTDEEMETLFDYQLTSESGADDVAYDLVWCLINSNEFILRH
jgi:hypothetical protein